MEKRVVNGCQRRHTICSETALGGRSAPEKCNTRDSLEGLGIGLFVQKEVRSAMLQMAQNRIAIRKLMTYLI